jgi:hypothetical protein
MRVNAGKTLLLSQPALPPAIFKADYGLSKR